MLFVGVFNNKSIYFSFCHDYFRVLVPERKNVVFFSNIILFVISTFIFFIFCLYLFPLIWVCGILITWRFYLVGGFWFSVFSISVNILGSYWHVSSFDMIPHLLTCFPIHHISLFLDIFPYLTCFLSWHVSHVGVFPIFLIQKTNLSLLLL